MFEQGLISVRNFFVGNFFVNIVGFKNTNTNNIFLLSPKNIFNNILHLLLLLVPLAVTTTIFNFFGKEVIYKYDKIFYITNAVQNKIIPVLLEFKAYCSSEPAYLYDLTSQIKYYNTSIPFNVFVNLNIPKIYDTIKIKYITKGKITEKHLLINDNKNYLIYNLFEN
jgi:hypothetical protein